jgi:hypothetical protein
MSLAQLQRRAIADETTGNMEAKCQHPTCRGCNYPWWACDHDRTYLPNKREPNE